MGGYGRRNKKMIYVVRDYIKGKCFKVDRETFIKLLMAIKDDDNFTSYCRKCKDGHFETIWATFDYDLIAVSNKEELDNLIKEIKGEYIKCVAKEGKTFAMQIVIAILMVIGFVVIITAIGVCIKLGVIK